MAAQHATLAAAAPNPSSREWRPGEHRFSGSAAWPLGVQDEGMTAAPCSHRNHTHAKPTPEGARQDTGTVNRLSQQRQQGGGDGMWAAGSKPSRGAGSRPVGSRGGGHLKWEGDGYAAWSMPLQPSAGFKPSSYPMKIVPTGQRPSHHVPTPSRDARSPWLPQQSTPC